MANESDSRRPGMIYKERAYGSPKGGAVGRVWDFERKIKIEVAGHTMYAGLLDKEAPRTCDALWSILPLTVPFVSLRWSGDGIQTHDARIDKMVEDNDVVLENFTLIGARGDLLFWPRDRGLFICYNYMYSKGITGEEPSNLFAHVLPEYYSTLYEVGRSIYLDSSLDITISRG